MASMRSELQAEIDALETRKHHLGQALGEFEHEARRVGDGLERAGGRAPELEARLKTLADNQRLTEKQIRKLDDEVAALNRRLAEIERLDDNRREHSRNP